MIRIHRGTTLLELLVALAVFFIVTGFSITGWQWLSERTQASSTRTNIERLFATARFAAVTHQRIVTICPLDLSNQCTNDWTLPAAIFLDPQSNLRLLSPDQLIRQIDVAPNGVLTPSNSPHGPRRYFQYHPDGSVRGTIGHLIWCPSSGKPEMAIQARLNFGGRLNWARDTNGNDIVEKSDGSDVSC